MKGCISHNGIFKMESYNISKTTIFIRKDLANRYNDLNIIDNFDYEGDDSNKMFLSKEKAKSYYNELINNCSIVTTRLKCGFLYYKLTRITLDKIEFNEKEVNEEINDNIIEENIDNYKSYIFENSINIQNIDEYRHNKEDLEKYRKGHN